MKTNAVLRELGSEYSVRVIDTERVVYRDFGVYDVEISGLDTRRAGCTVYVWEKSPTLHIAEIHDADSLKTLKAVLAKIEKFRD